MERRYAASAVIFDGEGKVLLARRSQTKFPYPGKLSLPSTYIKSSGGSYSNQRLPEEIARQQLKDAVNKKLGIDIMLAANIGEKEGQQEDYNLHMTDYIASISGGSLRPNGEDFSEAGFFDIAEKLRGRDRSKMGFCTQILLEELDKNPLFWQMYPR